MAKPRILYLSHDLFDLGYVEKIPDVTESKGFVRGKLSPSDVTITCRNNDNQFSIDNPVSFLNGSNWQYSPIKIYDEDNNLTFDGIVSNIIRDHTSKTVSIECKDRIFQNRKTPIAYTTASAAGETAATAAYNIMVQEGFTYYDNTALQNSISTLTANSCYVHVNILKQDDVSIFAALEKLGPYGAADVYMHKNKVVFKHWTAYTGGVSVAFDYGDPKLTPRTAPTITTLEYAFFNDYSIGYNGDLEVPATDAANGNIGAPSRLRFGTQMAPELRCNSKSANMVAFKDSTSAVYIGKTMIKRGHSTLTPIPKVLQVINFEVEYSFRSYIDLGTYFKMTFPDEGWTNKVFEVSKIQRNISSQNIAIEGWEVAI